MWNGANQMHCEDLTLPDGQWQDTCQEMKATNDPLIEARKTKRPNVLFIATDDLRVELGCYGNQVIKSPHIDRLAQRGVVFNRAYCQQAVCNPSRASVLSGLRPDTIKIWDLYTHLREIQPDIVTLPQLFKQNGYHTQCIGKIFHNWHQPKYKGDAPSWSVPDKLHWNTHSKDTAGENAPKSHTSCPRTDCRDVADITFFDGQIAHETIKALRECQDKPFFLGVGFWKPHLPFNVPKKYWDLYSTEEIGLPVNPNPPLDVPEIALHPSRELMRDFPDGLTEIQTLTLRHGYYAAVSYLDTQLGKVLDELDKLGLTENTIIVFWSDHGYHLGEHDLWCKTSNFELDARVPFIISAPGVQKQAGVHTDALVELLDIFPTLTDLCGLKEPHKLEGLSLRPILIDPMATVKSATFTQHPRPAYSKNGALPTHMGYSIRTKQYRYTEWRDIKSGVVTDRELYDHQNDSRETQNLANNVEFIKIVKTVAEQLQKVHP